MSGATIRVNNFEKFNPRKDLKRMPWVRLENDYYDREALFDEDPLTCYLFVFLLCQCAQKNKEEINFNKKFFLAKSRLDADVFDHALLRLERKGVIAVTYPGESGNSNGHDRTRSDSIGFVPNVTNERNGTNVTERNGTERGDGASPARKKTKGAIDELSGNPLVDEILSSVTATLQRKWLACYADAEFIKAELSKANLWCEANPRRGPKSQMGRFLSNWLARAWESHRKTIPANHNRAEQRQNNMLSMIRPVGGQSGN